jgi:REP element-mobilizing transposase RayT
LEKFYQYLSELIDVYSYCLLPNHFHFLIRVKEVEDDARNEDLPGFGISNKVKDNDSIAPSDEIDKQISEAFRRFFICYSQAINKQQNRTGSLFQKNFKRKLIDKETYLTRIIYYIHLNPELHKITESFENYPYSSYQSIININNTNLKSREVLNWFAGKRNYIEFHRIRLEDIKEIKKYLIE